MVINKGLAFSFFFFAKLIKGFGRIKSVVSPSCLYQVKRILLIDVFPFALAVGAIVAFFANAFVKRDAAPVKRFNNIFFCPGNITVLVGILYPEVKNSIMFFGKQIIKEIGRASCRERV